MMPLAVSHNYYQRGNNALLASSDGLQQVIALSLSGAVRNVRIGLSYRKISRIIVIIKLQGTTGGV